MNYLKDYILTFLKGMSMGAADVVPGVSGGSIALIAGIYQKLLDSIKSIDRTALGFLFKFEIKRLWDYINGSFLFTLLAGILTSIFSLSKVITYLMDNHPIPLWSFFCGLIIISAVIILRDIKRWNIGVILSLILGTIAAYWITGLPPTTTPDTLWFTFVAGAIAICAMILPGISGSFLLLVMGQYERILDAVNEKNLLIIALFGSGCVVGLLSFSRLISWLLKHYHAVTIGVLSGFMLGSLNKIWPWKEILSYRMSSSGEQKPFLTENMLPQNYMEVTGQEPLILYAVLSFLFGILLVLGIERTANYLKRS
jgi:putative membrane protein